MRITVFTCEAMIKNKILAIIFPTIFAVCFSLPLLETQAAEWPKMTEERFTGALEKALKDIITKIKPRAVNKINFRANLFFAHETSIKHMPLEVLKKQVDALKTAGVSGIDINMGLFPWLDKDKQTIAKYDLVINYIKAQNLEIVLNPTYSVVYHKPKDFDDWFNKAQTAWLEIARRYKPDIFVVIHEPTTQNIRLGFDANPQLWAGFVKKLGRMIKQISPGTKIGAGVHSKEREYFDEFIKIDKLDYVSFDIYSLAGLKVINQMIPAARKMGKKTYIEETWRPPHYNPKKELNLDYILAEGIGLARFAELDRLWLEMITLYASVWGLEAVTPFWTQAFFKYVENNGGALDRDYNIQVVNASLKDERTISYEKFADLIRTFGKRKNNP